MITPIFFFFNDTATTEIYTLSLHDALPIFHAAGPGGHPERRRGHLRRRRGRQGPGPLRRQAADPVRDRKSTRLNSSHANISYAVFCLKKKITYSSPTVLRLHPPISLYLTIR